MRLLPFLAISFLLVSCATSTVVERTYVDPEYKCKIWNSYHEECVKNITGSMDKANLAENERYAREVRNAWLKDIDYAAISPERKKFYQDSVGIARGQAIIAASQREEQLNN